MALKSRTKAKTKLLAALSLIFFAAFGCSSKGPAATRITINFWGTFETLQNIQPLITAYTQKHTNVTINYTQKDITTYSDDLVNALASGNGPDIFMIHDDWLPAYKDKMLEATATSFNVKDYKDTFVDAAVNDFIADGKIYAVPLTVDSLALYYNKDILGSNQIAVPPQTWDDLARDVRKIAKSDSAGYFYQSGVAMGTSANVNRAADIMYLLMLQNHVVPYTQDNSSSSLGDSVSDPATGNQTYPAADALTYYTSFATPSSSNYNWNTKSDYSIDAFAAGKAAFMYGYSFTRDTILTKAPNLNFDVAPVPQPKLGQNLVNFANYWGVGVAKQTKSPNTTWDFLNFITQKTQLQSYYKNHPQPSGRKDIIAEQTSDPELGVFASSNLTAKTFFKRNADKVDQVMTGMIDDVILRGKDITEAVTSASQQINLLNFAH